MSKKVKVAIGFLVALALFAGVFVFKGSQRSTTRLFSPISPHIYRQRRALSRDFTALKGPMVIYVAHIEDLNCEQAEKLLMENLVADGYMKTSGISPDSITYNKAVPGAEDCQVEIYTATMYSHKGILIVANTPANTTDIFVGRILAGGRDPFITREGIGDTPFEFLGE